MKWEVIQPTRGEYNWTGADLVSPNLSDRFVVLF